MNIIKSLFTSDGTAIVKFFRKYQMSVCTKEYLCEGSVQVDPLGIIWLYCDSGEVLGRYDPAEDKVVRSLEIDPFKAFQQDMKYRRLISNIKREV